MSSRQRFRSRWTLTRRSFTSSQSSVSSKRRGSLRPISNVKRSSASGSAATWSRRLVDAKTPSCAHWSHANSVSRAVTLSLRLEADILNSEVGKRGKELLAESFRRVVRARPACRGEKLVAGRVERTQVGLVLASALIDQRVELEVDLIEAARQMDGERFAVIAALEPANEAIRKTEVEQVGRGSIEPVLGEVEVARDLVARLDQRGRQWARLREHSAGKERDDVDVAGGPACQAKGEQSGAADDDELDPLATRCELLPKCGEQLVRLRLVHDGRDDSHPASRRLSS